MCRIEQVCGYHMHTRFKTSQVQLQEEHKKYLVLASGCGQT
jgi:hypothetical protein